MLGVLSLLLILQSAFAQFTITSDKDTYGAGDSIVASWDVSSPSVLKLDNQDVGKLLLCTCDGSKFTCNTIKDKLDIKKTKSYTFAVSDVSSLGPVGYYAFQLVSHSSKDPSSYTIVYTHSWFQITGGMTGSGEASNGCTIPNPNNNDVPGTATSSSIWTTSYTLPSEYQTVSGYAIPYTWQKGPTRTAPFQSTPGTKVTQKSTPTRRFPTSSFTPFKSYFINDRMPLTTATPGPVSTAVQYPNFVATIATTPTGHAPSRILPSLSLEKVSSSGSKQKRRMRRWDD